MTPLHSQHASVQMNETKGDVIYPPRDGVCPLIVMGASSGVNVVSEK